MFWQAEYAALGDAARIGNLEILHLMIKNGIGLNTSPLSSIIKKDEEEDKSEEEKLEIIKILCNVPEFINTQKVSFDSNQ